MYVLRMLPPDIETIREKEGIEPYSFREQRYARWYVGTAGKQKRERSGDPGRMVENAAELRFYDHNGLSRRTGGRTWSGSDWSKFHRNRGWSIELHYVGPYVGAETDTYEDDLTKQLMLFYGMNTARGGQKKKVRLKNCQIEAYKDAVADAKDVCEYCFEKGHYISNCPKRKRPGDLGYTRYYAVPTEDDLSFNRRDLVQHYDPVLNLPSTGPPVSRGNGRTPEDERKAIVAIGGQIWDTLVELNLPIRSCLGLHSAITQEDVEIGSLLTSCPDIKHFIKKYAPYTSTGANSSIKLRMHQYEIVKELEDYHENPRHVVLEAPTSAGKTLCQIIWAVYHLYKDPTATVMILVPTQAIMWNHAKTLEDVSFKTAETEAEKKDPFQHIISISDEENLSYGGTFWLRSKESRTPIRWTVWQGKGIGLTRNVEMTDHETHQTFQEARLIIATVDKIHHSLLTPLRSNANEHQRALSNFGKRVARNLSSIIIDEVHQCTGAFGGHVHWLLQRLQLYANNRQMRILVATATIKDAKAFTRRLIGCQEDRVHLITTGQGSRRVNDIGLSREGYVAALRNNLPLRTSRQWLRVVIFVEVEEKLSFQAMKQLICANTMHAQQEKNERSRALVFMSSKVSADSLQLCLSTAGRPTMTYNADLTPIDRRRYEMVLAKEENDGLNVIGTSALEMGVNIKGLDVTVIQRCPTDPMSIDQEIGRAGRKAGRPGIVVVGIDPLDPTGHLALSHPVAFLSNNSRDLCIPSSIETIVLQHARMLLEEWGVLGESFATLKNKIGSSSFWKVSADGGGRETLQRAAKIPVNVDNLDLLKDQWGDSEETVKTLLDNRYATVSGAPINNMERPWYRDFGLRGGGQMDGKVPVYKMRRLPDNTYRRQRWQGRGSRLAEIRRMSRMDVLKRLHPEGVLTFGGKFYRVVAYRVGLSGRAKALRKIKSRIIGDSGVPAMHNDYPALFAEEGMQADQFCADCHLNNMITSVSKCEFRTLHAFTDEKQTFAAPKKSFYGRFIWNFSEDQLDGTGNRAWDPENDPTVFRIEVVDDEELHWSIIQEKIRELDARLVEIGHGYMTYTHEMTSETRSIVRNATVVEKTLPQSRQFIIRFDQTPPPSGDTMPLLQIKVDGTGATVNAERLSSATANCERCALGRNELSVPRRECILSADNLPKCPMGEWLSRVQWVGLLEDEFDVLSRNSTTYGRISKTIRDLLPNDERHFLNNTHRTIKCGMWINEVHWVGYHKGFNKTIDREDVFARMNLLHCGETIDKFESGFHDDIFYSDVQLKIPGFEWEHSVSSDEKCCDAAAYVLTFRLSGALSCSMSSLDIKINYFPSRSSILVLDESDSGLVIEALQKGGLFFWEEPENVMAGFGLENGDITERLQGRENFDAHASDALETIQRRHEDVKQYLLGLFQCWSVRPSS
eukprot:g15987.t1